jgi:hypothetical protein
MLTLLVPGTGMGGGGVFVVLIGRNAPPTTAVAASNGRGLNSAGELLYPDTVLEPDTLLFPDGLLTAGVTISGGERSTPVTAGTAP